MSPWRIRFLRRNSIGSMRRRSAASPRTSVGKGPAPTRVWKDLATPMTRRTCRAPTPRLPRAPAAVVTELVTYEDLHISDRGRAWKDSLDGFYNRDGKVPCQVDGGLKCFGHPIGASGLRMLYEGYLQLNGRAEKRQLADPKLVLTHNLGGFPHQNVASVSIIGRYGKGG